MSRGKDKLGRVRTGNAQSQNRPKTAGTAGRPGSLFSDVRRLIEQARARTAVAVNVGQTMLYWQVGRRVGDEILGGQRAAYGERIIADLARALETDYGRGFAEKNLRRMVQFAEAFPDAEIVATLSRQLSWSQFVLLLPVKDALAREFYAEMCRVESWNVRTLRTRIQGMLFERTSLSRKPEQLARQELAALRSEDRMTPDIVFRDPYARTNGYARGESRGWDGSARAKALFLEAVEEGRNAGWATMGYTGGAMRCGRGYAGSEKSGSMGSAAGDGGDDVHSAAATIAGEDIALKHMREELGQLLRRARAAG